MRIYINKDRRPTRHNLHTCTDVMKIFGHILSGREGLREGHLLRDAAKGLQYVRAAAAAAGGARSLSTGSVR